MDNHIWFNCDVTNEFEITKILKKTLEKFGGIDIIISNAGFAVQKPLKDINKLIPQSVCLIGETDESTRKDVLANVGGKYKAILSTKLFDEGISCHRLDTLFLTCPSNNPIKLEQRIGRIIREHDKKQLPMIVDFWLRSPIVNRQQAKRLEWYISREYYIL